MSEFSDLTEDYAMLAVHISSKEAELKMLKEVKEKMGAAMLALMEQIGVSNAKSTAGHAVTKVKNKSAKVVDADAFWGFIFTDGDETFLEKRVSAEAVETYISEHEGACPPGVKFETVNTLRFTKAKS